MTLNDIAKYFDQKACVEIDIPGRDTQFSCFVSDMDILSEDFLSREIAKFGGDVNGLWVQLK